MTSSRQSSFSRTIILICITFILASLAFWKHNQGRTLSVPGLLSPNNNPQWLLAIFVAPDRFVRRDIIRATWASRYQHLPYDFRFIIGNYSSNEWASLIDAENKTHGDIWMLDDFGPETSKSANTDKNLYFFAQMAEHQGTRTRRYDFVSKVDDDIWFNVPPYYDTFMAPRLPGGSQHDPDALTWIGRPMHWDREYVFASGRIYTVSWPLLELLVEKWRANPTTTYSEDQLMGHYLFEERIPHEFVVMELEQAWDIGLESIVDGKNDTMVIHSIKHDDRLLELSSMFDDSGRWNGKLISGLTSYNRTMREVVDRIGEPSDEEMKALRKEWESRRDAESVYREDRADPKDTLDWKLIREKINIEDREGMGRMYPLNLPGNNASSGLYGTH